MLATARKRSAAREGRQSRRVSHLVVPEPGDSILTFLRAKATPPAKTDTKKTGTKKTDTKKPAAKTKEVTVKQGQDCTQVGQMHYHPRSAF